MSDLDLASLQPILAQFASQGRSGLLPALHAAQSIYGWLPDPVAAEIGKALHVPLADVNGVIDFYSMFYRKPVGKTILRICTDPPCSMAGSEQVIEAICRHLGVSPDEMTIDGQFIVERSPCLGLCKHAPALLVRDMPLGRAEPDHASEVCRCGGNSPIANIVAEPRILTCNCGQGKSTRLQEYLSKGGYTGLKKAFLMHP